MSDADKLKAILRRAPELYSNKVKVKGTMAEAIHYVPVDLKAIEAQRETKTSRIKKYIKEAKHFDWDLFGIITVAEIDELQGERRVVDGGHRLAMVKEYLPQVTEVPANIIKMKTEAEAAKLFHRFNGTSSAQVSNEERFVARVLGEDVLALETASVLESLGLKIIGNQETGTYAGAESGRSIKISMFEKIYNKFPHLVEIAVPMINEAWDDFDNTSISPMLLEGIVYMLHTIEQECDSKTAVDRFVPYFGKWLKVVASTGKPQRKMTYPDLRKDNHYGYSIAKGLYDEYQDYLKARFCEGKSPIIGTAMYPVAMKTFNDIYADIGKKH